VKYYPIAAGRATRRAPLLPGTTNVSVPPCSTGLEEGPDGDAFPGFAHIPGTATTHPAFPPYAGACLPLPAGYPALAGRPAIHAPSPSPPTVFPQLRSRALKSANPRARPLAGFSPKKSLRAPIKKPQGGYAPTTGLLRRAGVAASGYRRRKRQGRRPPATTRREEESRPRWKDSVVSRKIRAGGREGAWI